MKKVISMLLCIIMVCGVSVTANAYQLGDVINSTLYTDIVASINNYNIESYNIDGYTAIVAEDLRAYGFEVVYNNDKRALYITRGNTNKITSTYVAPVKDKSKIGQKVYDVLYTDIKTYLEGKEITSYNIDGRTIIYIDSLDIYGKVRYNNDTRRIDLTITDGLASKPIYLLETNPPYQISVGEVYNSKRNSSFKMAGKTYVDGITFGGVFYAGNTPYALFNLEGKYSTISFDIGYRDASMVDGLDASKYCTVMFYADGKVIKEINVAYDELPVRKEINVKSCQQLKIAVSNYKSRLCLGNIEAK